MDDSARETLNTEGLDVLVNTFHGLLHEAIGLVVRVNHRSEVRDANELLQSLYEK
jgi:hypothetical protein